jgi:hypothetical protein
MPAPAIVLEDDPTPLVRALAVELRRRLEDPEFASLTSSLTGSAALRAAGTPEAATVELGDGGIALRHGASAADAVATLDAYGRWDGDRIEGEGEHAELAAWLRSLASPPEQPWRDAATRFWAELERSPGAPAALVVVELDSGEAKSFGGGEPAYEIRAREQTLVALLEGRAALIDEAFARRAFIHGSFPDISVLSGASARLRMGINGGGDA